MPEGQSPIEAPKVRGRLWPRRKRWQFAFGVFLMMVGMIGYAWFTREQIVRDIISDELRKLEIPASYSINSIGPGEQILRNVVLGDPKRPDFVADEVRVELVYGLGAPQIGRIALLNPRLYGRYVDGEFSFGSLDKALLAPSEEPPQLPDFELDLIDGRALIESDFGDIGLKAEGKGNLANGFDGVLAASAPGLSDGACSAEKTSVFGRISSSDGLPAFNGPLRVRQLSCAERGVNLAAFDWQLELTGESDFSGFDAGGALVAQAIKASESNVESLAGDVNISAGEEGLRSRFDLAGNDVALASVSFSGVAVEGDLRAGSDFTDVSSDFIVTGEGMRLSRALKSGLADAAQATGLALLEPLAARLGRGLERVEQDSTLRANVSLRRNANALSVTIPQAMMTADRNTVASFSRVQMRFVEGADVPLITGNARISGKDLPQITARIEQDGIASSATRIRMEPYEAEGASLAIPDIAIVQASSGALRFSGNVVASGALSEDAKVEALSIPLDGQWGPPSGLALVSRCGTMSARAISHPRFAFEDADIEFCPSSARAGLRLNGGDVRADLQMKPANLLGMLDGESARFVSEGAVFSTTSGLSAEGVELTLGEGDTQTRFALSRVEGKTGNSWSGTFAGAEFSLGAVPLDVSQGQGSWSYENGVLKLNEANLRVTDRLSDPRFEALFARNATMSFEEGRLVAEADLREPVSDRVVSNVTLQHTFESGEGRADLSIENLVFDELLQPAAASDVCLNREFNPPGYRSATPGLSCLAFGIIANVEGSVDGNGSILWNAEEVTSSGTFTTTDADLAAAFGPLEGVSGTIEFTDLLDLTTAPDQRVAIFKVNPGVEVFDGEVSYNLREGQVLEIEGGRWPFLGGILALEPTVLDFREPQDRRYVFLIEGLDAPRFIEQMELGNISATGVFDGQVPIVFDTDGNGRIEQGLLRSRPPGGNVSYVGELTYEDLGAMANFAFQSLRSLDFTQMEVEMNGPLTGEIITRLNFAGVTQGKGADSNFVTRQIARLPIEFRINIRADFYSLLTNLQSLYDPAFVRDPRGLGLLESEGGRFIVPQPPQMPAIKPDDPENSDTSDEPAIQPDESEALP